MAKKILILVPSFSARGGITNYYEALRKHLPSNFIYFRRGARNWPKRSNSFTEFKRIFFDYLKFISILLSKKISLLQTSTAFYSNSIIRDGLFIIIAKMLSVKVIVFYHGWDDNFVHSLSGFRLFLYKLFFFRCDAIIDLSENNIKFLNKLGYTKKLFLETTLVDIDLIKKINISNLIKKRVESKTKTILFLSRVEKQKGIYMVLDIYVELKKENSDFELVIAGDGSQTENLQKRIIELGVGDVSLKGFVKGAKKKQLYEQATIFLFLSDFEGMPTVVLEAMAFGLPVITTNVGGISSIFVNNKNGVLLDGYNQPFIVEEIKRLAYNDDLYRSISTTNYDIAKQKFWSNVVAQRMIKIFDEIIAEK